jgi:hypothetical protein
VVSSTRTFLSFGPEESPNECSCWNGGWTTDAARVFVIKNVLIIALAVARLRKQIDSETSVVLPAKLYLKRYSNPLVSHRPPNQLRLTSSPYQEHLPAGSALRLHCNVETLWIASGLAIR